MVLVEIPSISDKPLKSNDSSNICPRGSHDPYGPAPPCLEFSGESYPEFSLKVADIGQLCGKSNEYLNFCVTKKDLTYDACQKTFESSETLKGHIESAHK